MNLEINPQKVYSIAKKEYMDNLRSKWILALTILFLVLTLVVSYFSVTVEPAPFTELTLKGNWNPSTNTQGLADGGLGGEKGDFYQVEFYTGNATSVDGNGTWNPGDWIYNDGIKWIRVSFKGLWDAANNTPEISDDGGNGTFADYYLVGVAGNTTIDGVSVWEVNNVIIHTGEEWLKIGDIEVATVKFRGFKTTVDGMSTLTSMLLPIIAIMLGYGAIISERENGSIGVVLGCPVSRFDVIIGKFMGLGGVIFTPIFVGFGIAGIIVGIFAGIENWLEYILFIIASWLFAMFFLGASIFFSTLANKRSTAIGGGLFLWFSGMIVGVVLIGVWAATGGDVQAMFSQTLQGGAYPEFPNWFWAGEFFNFMDLYGFGALSLFGISTFFGFEINAPDFVNAGTIFGWFFLLTFVSFVLSLLIMKKKDL